MWFSIMGSRTSENNGRLWLLYERLGILLLLAEREQYTFHSINASGRTRSNVQTGLKLYGSLALDSRVA